MLIYCGSSSRVIQNYMVLVYHVYTVVLSSCIYVTTLGCAVFIAPLNWKCILKTNWLCH